MKKPALGMPASKFFNLMKPALGTPALPPVPNALLWSNFSNSILTWDFLFSKNYISAKLHVMKIKRLDEITKSSITKMWSKLASKINSSKLT